MAGADRDDGELAIAHVVPQVIEPEARIAVGVFPAADAELVTNQHMELARTGREIKSEDAPQLDLPLCQDFAFDEGSSDFGDFTELGIHRDDDIAGVLGRHDVTHRVPNDH